MDMSICLQFCDPECPIKLEQHRLGKFRVTYRSEVMDNLNYPEAAAALGIAFMQSAAYKGTLNTAIMETP